MHPLLNRFLTEDASEALLSEILSEIGRFGASRVDVERRYSTNILEVFIGFKDHRVEIDGIFDLYDTGTCILTLAEFETAIRERLETKG